KFRRSAGSPRALVPVERTHSAGQPTGRLRMNSLVAEMSAKALKLNIPLSVQLDLTYRCNERCIHCYLDHDDHGARTTREIQRLLRQQGIHVIMANVLMRQNALDYPGVKALAAELGAQFMLDPTVTPMMDGDRSILNLNVNEAALREVFQNEALVGNVEEFCAPPLGPDEDALSALPCSAGHTACYVSPYGDVY